MCFKEIANIVNIASPPLELCCSAAAQIYKHNSTGSIKPETRVGKIILVIHSNLVSELLIEICLKKCYAKLTCFDHRSFYSDDDGWRRAGPERFTEGRRRHPADEWNFKLFLTFLLPTSLAL